MLNTETIRVYEATETFDAVVDGTVVTVRAGVSRLSEGHPLLRSHAHLFRLASVRGDVEQATDAPGERRGA